MKVVGETGPQIPADAPAVAVADLCVRRGAVRVLDGVTFEVAAGSACLLTGPEGSGKSSLLRTIAGMERVEHGSVRVLGVDPAGEPQRARTHIGYMPDTFGRYGEMTVVEYLDFFARAYSLRADDRNALVADLLSLADLEARHDERVDLLSRGQKQRLALARCLLHDPQVLLLDEPVAGLDSAGRDYMAALVSDLVALGKTALVGSGDTALAEVCASTLVLEAGRVLAAGAGHAAEIT